MRKVLFILSELADGDVDWMIQNGTKTAFPSGSVLIREGEPIEVLYVLLDGKLEVSLAALGGKVVAVLQCGEILGELSFLDSRPPSASVTAVEDATVLSIPRHRLTRKYLTESSEEPDAGVSRITVHQMIHKPMAKSVNPPAKTASMAKSTSHHQGNQGSPISGDMTKSVIPISIVSA